MSDPLAVLLGNATMQNGGTKLKVDVLFGDRPDVLTAIKKARVERKLGFQTIARLISAAEPKNSISDTAVENWLKAQGIY